MNFVPFFSTHLGIYPIDITEVSNEDNEELKALVYFEKGASLIYERAGKYLMTPLHVEVIIDLEFTDFSFKFQAFLYISAYNYNFLTAYSKEVISACPLIYAGSELAMIDKSGIKLLRFNTDISIRAKRVYSGPTVRKIAYDSKSETYGIVLSTPELSYVSANRYYFQIIDSESFKRK